jgi:hypothetical protein
MAALIIHRSHLIRRGRFVQRLLIEYEWCILDNFYDIKDFQDYMEDKIGQEIDIESSIDPVTKLEKDDKRVIFHPLRKGV